MHNRVKRGIPALHFYLFFEEYLNGRTLIYRLVEKKKQSFINLLTRIPFIVAPIE